METDFLNNCDALLPPFTSFSLAPCHLRLRSLYQGNV